MKIPYDWMYRNGHIPWDNGPHESLVNVIEESRIEPCKTLELGCGSAHDAIFMAQHGFDVTGIDFSQPAIDLGRERAREAGVDITFVQDDLTKLQHISGTYDFLVDCGTLDDLSTDDRQRYMRNVLPLTHPSSHFFLFAFEWSRRWWERFYPFQMFVEPGEVQERFGDYFEIERIATFETGFVFMPWFVSYWMTRKDEAASSPGTFS